MWVVTSPTSNRTYLLSATRNWTSASDFCRFDNKRPSTASLQWEHETDAAFEPSELACDKNSKTLRVKSIRRGNPLYSSSSPSPSPLTSNPLSPIIAEAGFDRAFASAPNHRNKSKQYELDAHAAFPIDMQPPPAYAETAVSQQPVPMSPLNPNMSRHRLSNIFTPERGWLERAPHAPPSFYSSLRPEQATLLRTTHPISTREDVPRDMKRR
eukprot:m.947013 g.947013  ORF g.947013 m.947013 type:complete len:212 (-) comp23848_c0_seq9:282-917(-)